MPRPRSEADWRIIVQQHEDVTFNLNAQIVKLRAVVRKREQQLVDIITAGNAAVAELSQWGWGDFHYGPDGKQEQSVIDAVQGWNAAVAKYQPTPCPRCHVPSSHPVIAALSNLWNRPVSHAEAQRVAKAICPACNPANADREPQPSDGPDYHADHQAWKERQDAQADEG